MAEVLVPVPEALVEEVTAYIERLRVRASLEPWTADSVLVFLANASGQVRHLLASVATAVTEGRTVPDTVLLDDLDVPMSRLQAMLLVLGLHVSGPGRENLVELVDEPPAPDGDGTSARHLTMDPDLARLVLEAEAQVADAVGPPLG